MAFFGRTSFLDTKGDSLFDAALNWAADSAYKPAVLIVAGSTTLSAAETVLKQRLEGLGFLVATATATNAAAQAVGKVAVVISDSASGAGLTALRTLAVPVITWNRGQYSALGFTGAVSGTDFGASSSLTAVNIVAPSHALAAGLSGQPEVLDVAANLSWGVPAAGGAIVASLPSVPTRATVFAYEAGGAMSGLTAPDRRVGFFLSAGAASLLSAKGGALFDAALLWAGTSDVDRDGLDRRTELQFGTDPADADSNDDGVRDGDAVRLGLSPTSLDTDQDGLSNANERTMGTDPLNPDTDGDGVTDGADAFPLDPTQTTAGPTDASPPAITLFAPADAVLVSTNP